VAKIYSFGGWLLLASASVSAVAGWCGGPEMEDADQAATYALAALSFVLSEREHRIVRDRNASEVRP
jgi:hypothetical protein